MKIYLQPVGKCLQSHYKHQLMELTKKYVLGKFPDKWKRFSPDAKLNWTIFKCKIIFKLCFTIAKIQCCDNFLMSLTTKNHVS